MSVVKRKPVPRMNEEQIKSLKKMLDEERGREEMQSTEEYHEIVNEGVEYEEVQETEKFDNKEEEEMIINKNQETNKTYNLAMFQPASSVTTSRSSLQAGVMSVINSNCGKRVTLSKDLMDKLNNPTMVSISFSEEGIAIGETLPNNNSRLNVKLSGKKGVIYSAGIVSEITDKFSLDFNNRTSITFSEVDFIEVYGSTIAIINTKKAN